MGNQDDNGEDPCLIHARWQQLDDGKVLPRPLHGLPHCPVVKGPLHLDMVATMTPCAAGLLITGFPLCVLLRKSQKT